MTDLRRVFVFALLSSALLMFAHAYVPGRRCGTQRGLLRLHSSSLSLRDPILRARESTGAPLLLQAADQNCRSMVICGPSGAGKGTIIEKLMEKFPDFLALSVSHTTRQPRPGEIEGVHYHFVKRDKMAADISAQQDNMRPRKFLEYAEVHTNLYGTSLKAVQNIWSKGKLAILDVDTKGVEQIRESRSVLAKYIFIVPPTLEELQRRLTSRGTETPEQVAMRMRNAQTQLLFAEQNAKIWDLVLENGNLDESVDYLVSVMQGWFPERLRGQ